METATSSPRTSLDLPSSRINPSVEPSSKRWVAVALVVAALIVVGVGSGLIGMEGLSGAHLFPQNFLNTIGTTGHIALVAGGGGLVLLSIVLASCYLCRKRTHVSPSYPPRDATPVDDVVINLEKVRKKL